MPRTVPSPRPPTNTGTSTMSDQSTNQPFSKRVTFISEVHKSGWGQAREKLSVDEGQARHWWDWYQQEVCTPWVIREEPDGFHEIEAQNGEAADVNSLPLIVSDVREVQFANRVYALDRDGLYRFLLLTQSVRNLIVARDNALLPILRGLSGLQVHGYRDMEKPQDELKAMLPTCSFVGITCGTIASLSASVLTDLGFRTRSVGSMTLGEWNTYDNGHALFEVYCPRAEKWILADVDMGFVFRQGDTYLDAGQLWEALQQSQSFALVPLASSLVDPFFMSPTGFNYFLRFRWKWQNDDGKLAWYRRIFQAVGVSDGAKRVYVGRGERIREYVGEDAEVLPYAEWRARFYGE